MRKMVLVTVVLLFAFLVSCLPVEAAAPPRVVTQEVSKKVYKASGYHLGNNVRGDDIVRLDVFVAKQKNGKYLITTTEQWLVNDMPNLTGQELAKQRAQMGFLQAGLYNKKKGGEVHWDFVEATSTRATATVYLLDREGREMYVTQVTERPDGVPYDPKSTSVDLDGTTVSLAGDPAEWVTTYYADGQPVPVDDLKNFFKPTAE
ncbi:hypothetical protein IJ096_02435 [Candidatus Saccharibacteria bacterium]|nr:hypothetical protein [Candidatus Saccharibacteria bacterium]